MKLIQSIGALIILFSSVMATVLLQKAAEDPNNPKYFKLKFNKLYGDSYESASPSNTPLFKRSNGYEEVTLVNQQSFYSVQLQMGSPPQEVTVLVDTGSSDLWVTGSNNPFCHHQKQPNKKDFVYSTQITIGGGIDPFSFLTESGFTFTTVGVQSAVAAATATSNIAYAPQATIDCTTYGTFNTNKSSSYSSNETSFQIKYGDGSYAAGTWGQDILTLHDLNITGVSFGVANYTNSSVGVLGIGLSSLESTYSGSNIQTKRPYQYQNLPLSLKNSGAINTVAYSLYLDNANSKHGSVLFGAVDHSKYSGSLYTLPMVNIYKEQGYQDPIEFDITLQGIGVSSSANGNVTISTTKIPALLDSGTTISYLPTDLVSLIAEQIGASYSSASGFYQMNCISAEDDTNLVFDFGGFHISAPLSDFLISTTSSNSQCIFAMAPQTSDAAILGDVFLTHAYVVYDLENFEISLAQADYSSDSSDTSDQIDAIGSLVPSAIRAASYSNTWSTSEEITTGGNIFTLPGNSTTTDSGRVTATRASRSSATRSSASNLQRKNNQVMLSAPSLLLSITTFIFSFII